MTSAIVQLLVHPIRHLYALLWRTGLIEIKEPDDGDNRTA